MSIVASVEEDTEFKYQNSTSSTQSTKQNVFNIFQNSPIIQDFEMLSTWKFLYGDSVGINSRPPTTATQTADINSAVAIFNDLLRRPVVPVLKPGRLVLVRCSCVHARSIQTVQFDIRARETLDTTKNFIPILALSGLSDY